MRMLGYLVVAGMLTTFNVVNAGAPTGMEACYGIAKAGQNDCADASTTCVKSVIDGDPNYFLYVPTGACNKIVGGTLNASADMDMPAMMPSTTTPMPSTTTPMPSTPSSTNSTSTTGTGMSGSKY